MIVPSDFEEQRVDIFLVWLGCFVHVLNISIYRYFIVT